MAKKRTVRAPDLDTKPFMNLMVILIPFLLLSAVFVEVTIIRTSLPIIADESTAPPPPDEEKNKKPPLNLSLNINKEGYYINAEQDLEIKTSYEQASASQVKIPIKSGNQYDVPGLHQVMKDIKKNFPNESAIIISADNEIPYETVVSAMDATRDYIEETATAKVVKEMFHSATIGVIF